MAGRFSIENLGEASNPSPIERVDGFRFTSDAERIALNPIFATANNGSKPLEQEGFELAGPRARIYFDPSRARTAIVTCGGLCPGINAVVRGLVLQLWFRYSCRDILGIRYGFGGLGQKAEPPVKLTPESVADIHMQGGTVLGTSRGTPPAEEIVDHLVANGINILFTIGGDGTMRGATAIWNEIKRRNLKIAVVGLPKTIDNDIPFVRRAFGFETAVSIATQSVHSAHVEATGAPYGVGLVKLMGRHAGYIAATTCLAAGQANICLIPEVPFELEGPNGLLQLVEARVRSRRHCVIVVAEGAGQQFFVGEEQQHDASGNIKLRNIGTYLQDRITAYCKERGLDMTLKYIDPSYLIRSAPANPTDQLLCARLAQNAVHAAMAGKSGLLIGYWHGLMTHVPMAALSGRKQAINPEGETWFNVLETTGQPVHIGT